MCPVLGHQKQVTWSHVSAPHTVLGQADVQALARRRSQAAPSKNRLSGFQKILLLLLGSHLSALLWVCEVQN